VVAIEIGEAALIPAAAVLGDSRGAGACCQGFVHKLIHLVRALKTKNQDRLSARGRIGDALRACLETSVWPTGCDRIVAVCGVSLRRYASADPHDPDL
jgi:hypothetical protein